jgi:hypothetical protein
MRPEAHGQRLLVRREANPPNLGSGLGLPIRKLEEIHVPKFPSAFGSQNIQPHACVFTGATDSGLWNRNCFLDTQIQPVVIRKAVDSSSLM